MKPHAFATLILLAVPLAAYAGAASAEPDQARQRETMRFRAMDTNGDGILSGDEVRMGATRGIDEDEDYDQARRPEFRNWTPRGFESLDQNGNGRIERSEWHYDREAFLRADRNGDNVLTRSEFLGNDTDLGVNDDHLADNSGQFRVTV